MAPTVECDSIVTRSPTTQLSLTTTCESKWQLAPIRLSPITQYGPITVPTPICAPGAMMAVGWIVVSTAGGAAKKWRINM